MSFAKAHSMMFFETSAKNPPNKHVNGRRGNGEALYQQDNVEDIVIAFGAKLKRQKKTLAANAPSYSGSFKVLNKKRPEKEWTCCWEGGQWDFLAIHMKVWLCERENICISSILTKEEQECKTFIFEIQVPHRTWIFMLLNIWHVLLRNLLYTVIFIVYHSCKIKDCECKHYSVEALIQVTFWCHDCLFSACVASVGTNCG